MVKIAVWGRTNDLSAAYLTNLKNAQVDIVVLDYLIVNKDGSWRTAYAFTKSQFIDFRNSVLAVCPNMEFAIALLNDSTNPANWPDFSTPALRAAALSNLKTVLTDYAGLFNYIYNDVEQSLNDDWAKIWLWFDESYPQLNAIVPTYNFSTINMLNYTTFKKVVKSFYNQAKLDEWNTFWATIESTGRTNVSALALAYDQTTWELEAIETKLWAKPQPQLDHVGVWMVKDMTAKDWAGLAATSARLKNGLPPPTPPPPTVYTCPTCQATFSTQALLDQHIATAHPPEPPPPTYQEWIVQKTTPPPTQEWKITVEGKPGRVSGWV